MEFVFITPTAYIWTNVLAQLVPGTISQGTKWHRLEADHSLQYRAEIKNDGVPTPLAHTSVRRDA
jgi:hypothetical protein